MATEEKRKHNLLAGALLAAPAIPLLRASGRFGAAAYGPRIAKAIESFAPKAASRLASPGMRAANYIEGAQQTLNRGLHGKAIGHVLQHPKSELSKMLVPKIGAAGVGKTPQDHYSSFRSGHRSALQSWIDEHGIVETDKLSNLPNTLKPKVRAARKVKIGADIDKHAEGSVDLMGDFDKLTQTKGLNEREALRRVASDPKHQETFQDMLTAKMTKAPDYAIATGAAAAVPLAIGGGVALTTRKDKKKFSAREKLGDIIELGLAEEVFRIHLPASPLAGATRKVRRAFNKGAMQESRLLRRLPVNDPIKAWKHGPEGRFSARDELYTIIQFGSSGFLRDSNWLSGPSIKVSERIRYLKGEELLRKKLKPGKLIPMMIPGDSSGVATKLSAREELNEVIQLGATRVGRLISSVGNRSANAGAALARPADKLLSDLGTSYAHVNHPAAFTGSTMGSFKKDIDRIGLKPGAKGASIDQSYHRNMVAGMVKKWRSGGYELLARDELNTIIQLGPDPRPRNTLGEFSGSEEGGPDPNNIAIAYKQPTMKGGVVGSLEGGAVAGVGAASSGFALKALISKIKSMHGA